MAAHLARHVNTIHGARGRKKSATRFGTSSGKRGPGRPKGSRNAYRSFTPGIVGSGTASAAGLLGNMQNFHADLVVQRDTIDQQIDAVAQAIEVMGAAPVGFRTSRGRRPGRPKGRGPGRPAGRGPGRPKGTVAGRSGSLKDFIVRVMSQTTQSLSPRDIGERVKQAGFKTKARDLTKAVSNTLPDLKRIRRVGFGQYKLS
jgi:hypothetical protein